MDKHAISGVRRRNGEESSRRQVYTCITLNRLSECLS